jgi:tetratricopeptide (TPR) repeat protein
MHQYDNAERAFRKMKDLEKNDPAVFLNIGLIYLEQKLPESAIRELRPLLEHPQLREKVRHYIALALEEKGDLKAAAREYQLVNRDSEHFIPARLRMAYLLYQQQETAQAHRILEEIRPLAPDREEIYLTLSYFYEKENQVEKALEILKEGLGQVQKPLEIHFRLAVLYDKQKNREESIRHIKQVLELEPANPEAQNFLGYSYAEAGIKLDEAENLIRDALQARPDSAHIIDSLGWVLFKKGQYDKAVAELEKASRLLPQDGTVAEHLGDAYFQQKRYQEALRLYKRATSLENANVPELRKKIEKLENLLGTPAGP